MKGWSRSSNSTLSAIVFLARRIPFWLAVLILHLPLSVSSPQQANDLTWRNDPPYPLHLLASFDPVQQVTLFQCYSNEAERRSSTLAYDPFIARREECCRAILLLSESQEIPFPDDVRRSIQCDNRAAGTGGVRSVAEVPAVDFLVVSNLLPSYVLLHAALVTSPTRWQPPAPADDDEAGAENRNVTVWSHLVWDALQNRVVLDRTNQLESAWEVLSSFHKPALPAESRVEPAHFHASLHSTLSDSGGMHRLLHVVITSHIPPRAKSSFEETGSWELDLYSLLYLPSGVFVNVHDAFDHPNDARTNLRVQLITVKGATIDEEQPEFASPSHAVLVRIQATVDAAESRPMDAKQHTMAFNIKLHLRYPPTISTAGDSTSRLVVLSPYLVSGTLRRTTNVEETYRWTPPKEDFPRLHVAWVSAGKQSDAGVVMVVTLLVLLGGTLGMLGGISKIVAWE
jgi:PIG-X / PBN1